MELVMMVSLGLAAYAFAALSGMNRRHATASVTVRRRTRRS